MKPIILVVGCPASGKTWVCQKLGQKFLYVAHDDYNEREYPTFLLRSVTTERPVIGEIPFGLSKIQGELTSRGAHVVPVFIYEEEPVLRARYQAREGRPIIPGHLKRQETHRSRARELGAFIGTSAEVLEHLKALTL